MLGRERVDWLTRLPIEWRQEDVAVVHAVPGDCWAVVEHDATDQALIDTFGVLGVPIAVYGHIHRPYLRRIDELTVVDSGSVSLSADGDPRASYVVLDSGRSSIAGWPTTSSGWLPTCCASTTRMPPATPTGSGLATWNAEKDRSFSAEAGPARSPRWCHPGR